MADIALARKFGLEDFEAATSTSALHGPIEETFEEKVGDAYEENLRRAHIEGRIKHLQASLDDLNKTRVPGRF